MKFYVFFISIFITSFASAEIYYFQGKRVFPENLNLLSQVNIVIQIEDSYVRLCQHSTNEGNLFLKHFFSKHGDLLFLNGEEVGAITSNNLYFQFKSNNNQTVDKYRLTWSLRDDSFRLTQKFNLSGMFKYIGKRVNNAESEAIKEICY